jgi:hypothetical protein
LYQTPYFALISFNLLCNWIEIRHGKQRRASATPCGGSSKRYGEQLGEDQETAQFGFWKNSAAGAASEAIRNAPEME